MNDPFFYSKLVVFFKTFTEKEFAHLLIFTLAFAIRKFAIGFFKTSEHRSN